MVDLARRFRDFDALHGPSSRAHEPWKRAVRAADVQQSWGPPRAYRREELRLRGIPPLVERRLRLEVLVVRRRGVPRHRVERRPRVDEPEPTRPALDDVEPLLGVELH